LSARSATTEAAMMVKPATHGSQANASAAKPIPKTYTTTLTIENTPAFTTATACSSAETGVGATIAAGSQRCSGISAALPMPKA
jgi:hypothetical protein